MDGARFGNALARMNVSPAEATWKAGIDVLSFGATKGGAMAAEAVVFFDPARSAFMGERRKRAGHLLSKHRFLAAQFEGYLEDGYWLALARHANDMADLLADGLRAAGAPIVWPVEANIVFTLLPRALGCEAEGRRRGLLRAKQRARRRRCRDRARPDAGAAGNVICDAKARNRTIRLACEARLKVSGSQRRRL